MDVEQNSGPYGIDEARDRLPDLVARAMAGETVLIADAGGKTVALEQRGRAKRQTSRSAAGLHSDSRSSASPHGKRSATAKLDLEAIRRLAAQQPRQGVSAGEFMRQLRDEERF